MCEHGLQSQCETTQVHEHDCGAALFGYTKLYGQVPGGQAELSAGAARRTTARSRCPAGPPDDRFLFLSDVLPTAWQGVQYADVPTGGSLVVLGLGPIGDMACRIALHRGIETVIGDRPRARSVSSGAAPAGSTVLDLDDFDKQTRSRRGDPRR